LSREETNVRVPNGGVFVATVVEASPPTDEFSWTAGHANLRYQPLLGTSSGSRTEDLLHLSLFWPYEVQAPRSIPTLANLCVSCLCKIEQEVLSLVDVF
jgi:hypothetical protein